MKDLIARHALFAAPVIAALLAAVYMVYAGTAGADPAAAAVPGTMSIPF